MTHFLDSMTREHYEQRDHAWLVAELGLRDQQYRTLERNSRAAREHDRLLYDRAARAVARVVREHRAAGKRSVSLNTLTQTLAGASTEPDA